MPSTITSMAESPSDINTLRRRRSSTKRAIPRAEVAPASDLSASPLAPCGACKFLRRKCINGCIFAPYFGSDQGSAKFAAVHKVFGASNVSKLLLNLPVNKRHEAVLTVCYEAQARLSDPVYGCVTTILALQQQVAALQAELAMVQSQVVNSKLMVASAIQNSQQHQHVQLHAGMLQPTYSNNSCSSNNLMNMSGFTTNYELAAEIAPSSHSLDHIQMSKHGHDDDENEEESHLTMRFLSGDKF